MPTYDYICHTCGERFDYFQSMSSPPLKSHPNCKEKKSVVKRVVSGGSGLIFKGSGFYLTDYKKNKKSDTSDKPNANSKKEKKPNKKKEVKND